MGDIETREDCAALVRAFYTKALADAVIGFLFTDVAHLDLDHHLPRITRFWETVLLGARTYGGGAFRPHLALNLAVPLRRGHFERWLWLWQGTVDELYAGPVADEAKRHAARVASAFHARIEAINAERPDPGPNVDTELALRSDLGQDLTVDPGLSPRGDLGPGLTVSYVRAKRGSV